MASGGRRALLVATGVALFVLYLGLAVLFVDAFAVLIANPPNLRLFAVAVVASALGLGYLSYLAGPVRILQALDARRIPRTAAPGLHRRLDALCERMDAPRPRVYVAALDAPNALAVGARNGGIVVVDHRLPHLLRPDELDAILAHELAHLEGYDGLVQTLGATLLQTVATLVFLALLPAGILLAGFTRATTFLTGRQPAPFGVHLARTHYRVAQLVTLALLGFTLALRAHSRRRELAADDRATEVTGNPLALARALARIQRASDPYRGRWSNLFVHGQERHPLSRLLDTHPQMDHRIERLRQKATQRDRIPVRTR